MKLTKTLAGCIDVWEDSCEFPENTIKFVENTCSDPERLLVNWEPFDDHCDYLNLSKIYKNSPNPIMHKVYEDFNLTMIEIAPEYITRYGIKEDHHTNSPYHMLRYQAGSNYSSRYDGPTQTGRNISVIQYLNDDYEGGEIIFPLHNVWIKPKAGMLLMFPSSWAYQNLSQPITKGTKYTNVTWLHDRK